MAGRPLKQDTEMYERLFNLLRSYISDITASVILDRALRRCGVSTDHLLAETLLAVVEQARVGIGMFCDPDRLTSLMLDLASFCDSSMLEKEDADTDAAIRTRISTSAPAPRRIASDSKPAGHKRAKRGRPSGTYLVTVGQGLEQERVSIERSPQDGAPKPGARRERAR